MEKKECPESFVCAGAALVALRHALMDVAPLFALVKEKMEAAHLDLKLMGFRRSQLARAENLLADAGKAPGFVMEAHNWLSEMLVAGHTNMPTDDQILKVCASAKHSALMGTSLRTLERLGNWR